MDIKDFYKIYVDCGKVCTDSRNVIAGSIFFALKGENFNGNLFALQALEDGCKYAVVDEPVDKDDNRLIRVPDVLAFLQELASHHRRQFSIPVIGITGTNGKTTTKELMNAVLSQSFEVTATRGNLNNHIGVPLTLLGISNSTQIAIIEMGANHVGEIAALCEIAEPGFGLITNIGNAHLEGFGSPEKVVEAKSELYNYIRKNQGSVFINGDDDLLQSLSDGIKTVTYGKGISSNIQANPSGDIFVSVEWRKTGAGLQKAPTKLIGEYNFTNIMAAICIGDYFGVEEALINEALRTYEPGLNRSQYVDSGKNQIILDAYNANPDSMSAAISNFGMISSSNKVAILGDMFELGSYSMGAHENVILELKSAGVDEIYLVGPEFVKALKDNHGNAYLNVKELIKSLVSSPISDSLILLKGSRGMRMEQLLEYL